MSQIHTTTVYATRDILRVLTTLIVQVGLFAHPLNLGPFDEELLGAFVPHLQLVAGMGAGFDHGMCFLLALPTL